MLKGGFVIILSRALVSRKTCFADITCENADNLGEVADKLPKSADKTRKLADK